MKHLSELQVGDEVYCDGNSSFCHLTKEAITKIEVRYDEMTGAPYNVIFIGDRQFHGITGNSMNPKSQYFIEPINDPEPIDKDEILNNYRNELHTRLYGRSFQK